MSLLRVYLKGLLIGCADLIPGVSGATLALLTGIYGRILEVLYALDVGALRLLLRGELRALSARLQTSFVLALLLGILSSLLLFARALRFCLEHYPIPFWAFFMGLIIAVSYTVYRDLPLRRHKYLILFVCLGLGLSLMTSFQPEGEAATEGHAWMLFLSGLLAVCAMLLPGISGSFVLVLLGKYRILIEALAIFEIDVLLIFCSGAVIGLLSFGRVIYLLWHRYPRYVLALIMGLMLGALPSLWPWKQDGKWYGPWAYAEQVGEPSQLLMACLSVAFAGCLVLFFAPKSFLSDHAP